MARPTGSMVLGFSDHQAAEGWSSDEEIEDKVAWEIYDELTEDSSDETDDQEECEAPWKSKYTKGEALEILKEEKGDYSKTTQKILTDVMNDSLELLSSQAEEKKNVKLQNMTRKLRRLDKKRKDKKLRHSSELNETFEKLSQSSLAEIVKQEKGVKCSEKEVKNPAEKKYRKPLDKCRSLDTISDRTDEILKTIRDEAQLQEVTNQQLLAFLLYRVSYEHNRDLAKKMFQLFRSGEWQPGLEPVGKEKMLALTERCRLGKGGFRYLHRQLKPHGLKMPYYPAVADLRRQTCPVLRPYCNMAGQLVGVTAGLRDSLQLTLRRHIQSGQAGYLETANSSLAVGVTIGFDGRGEKTEYKQKSTVGIDTSHSLSCQFMMTEVSKLASSETDCLDRNRDPEHRDSNCVVGRTPGSDWKCGGGEAGQDGATDLVEAGQIKKPFHYQQKDGVVWQEHQLGSTWAARPLAIVMQRETRENTVSFVKKYLNPEVRSLKSYGSSSIMDTDVEERGAGEKWVLFSPRGRRIVSRESCSTIHVDSGTVLKNPLPMREMASPAPPPKRPTLESLSTAATDTPPQPSPEVLRQRFSSFQYAMSRGKVKGIKVENGVSNKKLTETLDLLKTLN